MPKGDRAYYKFSMAGWKELDKAMAKLAPSMQVSTLRKALKRSAQPVIDEAKRLVPVDDGDLRESITMNTRLKNRRDARQDRSESAVIMYLGTSTPLGSHGHLLEFGTKNHPAQPFLRPAWEKHKKKVLDNIQAELWNELRKTAKRLAKRAAKGNLSRRDVDALSR